jgi:hypothetical protein
MPNVNKGIKLTIYTTNLIVFQKQLYNTTTPFHKLTIYQRHILPPLVTTLWEKNALKQDTKKKS